MNPIKVLIFEICDFPKVCSDVGQTQFYQGIFIPQLGTTNILN